MTSSEEPSRHSDNRGLVFDIQRYCIHDGPGIRTVVFLKGCPLSCPWCENPESQLPIPEIGFFTHRCIGCGECISICPHKAVKPGKKGTGVIFERTQCRRCGKCADKCPTNARVLIGRSMSVNAVMLEVERDLPFYRESGGGMTISGGEPAAQLEFTIALLQACRRIGIQTAVETSGYCQLEKIAALAQYSDLILIDLKNVDAELFRSETGGEVQSVLENIRWIDRHGLVDYIIRIPIITGFNTSPKVLAGMVDFLGELQRVHAIHLLPYHRLGEGKYRRLGREDQILRYKIPDDGELNMIAKIFAETGIRVQIGG